MLFQTVSPLGRLFVVVLDAGNDTERFYDLMYWFITVGFCEAVKSESKHTVIKLVLRKAPNLFANEEDDQDEQIWSLITKKMNEEDWS